MLFINNIKFGVIKAEGKIMREQLIYGKKSEGKYFVRPISWEGIWNKNGELLEGNTLYDFDTQQECIECIKVNEIYVYRMNDCEWWASKLSIEETEKFYRKEVGEENAIEDIEECDIDHDGMWWDTEDKADLEKLGAADEIITYETKNGKLKVSLGDLVRRGGEVYKYIPFRIALMKSGEHKEPFCLASTEW